MTTTTNTASDSTERVAPKEEASTTIPAVTATSPMKTDQPSTASLATTSDKPKGDELPADLECTEEMSTGSPEASKSAPTSNPSTSDPNVVRIHSESSSRAQSPIDVCTPLDSLTTATASLKPPSSPSSSQPPLPTTTTTTTAVTTVASSLPKATLTMHELDTALLDQLEELMFEGELLEVGLDEVQQIWAILQIQRPLSKDTCNVMNADYRRKLVKDRKKARKRKLEEAKSAQQAALKAAQEAKQAAAAAKQAAAADAASAAKKMREEAKVKIKQEVITDVVEDVSKDGGGESQDEDDCSAKPCKKPLGDEVEWVQCDKCENWYHVVCVGISAQDASKIDEYVCPYCTTPVPTPTSTTPMDIDSAAANTMAGLSVIAQVAHQIISNQEKNEGVQNVQTPAPIPSAKQLDPPSTPQVVTTTPPQQQPQPQPPPSSLDLLLCLADASEKMDSTPVVDVGENNSIITTTETTTMVKEVSSIETNCNQPQAQPMDQS